MSVVLLDFEGTPKSPLEVAAEAIQHYQQCLAAWRYYLTGMAEIRGHIAARRFDEAMWAADQLEEWIATNVGEMDVIERDLQQYREDIERALAIERQLPDAPPLPPGTRTH